MSDTPENAPPTLPPADPPSNPPAPPPTVEDMLLSAIGDLNFATLSEAEKNWLNRQHARLHEWEKAEAEKNAPQSPDTSIEGHKARVEARRKEQEQARAKK